VLQTQEKEFGNTALDMRILANDWLDIGWILAGYFAWILAGYWLDIGWILAGYWLDIGWALAERTDGIFKSMNSSAMKWGVKRVVIGH